MEYLRHLLSFSPGPFGMFFQKFLAVVFGAILVSGIAAWAIFFFRFRKNSPVWAELWRRIFHFGITMGLSGLLLLFFARQEIYVFGARFWFLLWLALAAGWTIFIMRHAFVRLPRRMKERKERRRLGKYLPKKKK